MASEYRSLTNYDDAVPRRSSEELLNGTEAALSASIERDMRDLFATVLRRGGKLADTQQQLRLLITNLGNEAEQGPR